MTGMDAREEKKGGRGCAIGLVVMLLLLPVLYVLSFGPVYAIAVRFPATKEFLAAVYRPVIYLGEHFEPMRGVFDWYMGFWL
jgi:hypothetical protein